MALKRGPYEAEVRGTALVFSSCSEMPFLVRLQISSTIDDIVWLECKIGQTDSDGELLLLKWGSDKASKLFGQVGWDLDKINWYYHVAFGERRMLNADKN